MPRSRGSSVITSASPGTSWRRCRRAPITSSTLMSPGTRNGGTDQLAGLGRIAPAQHLHPLGGLQILVVLEEVLDLHHRDVGQVRVVVHMLVAASELGHRHRDDLLVTA